MPERLLCSILANNTDKLLVRTLDMTEREHGNLESWLNNKKIYCISLLIVLLHFDFSFKLAFKRYKNKAFLNLIMVLSSMLLPKQEGLALRPFWVDFACSPCSALVSVGYYSYNLYLLETLNCP